MNTFLEIPTWLGDSVMITPTIENIVKHYPDAKITIFGSSVATSIFKYHPNVVKIIKDDTKSHKNRLKRLKFLVQNLENFDYALSFRTSFFSKLLLFFIGASEKKQYKHRKNINKHQVLRYQFFVNKTFGFNNIIENLKIYTPQQSVDKQLKILGINPGATYGSAKRWDSMKFAQTINKLEQYFDEVVIFGSNNEVDIARDIEKNLTITHYKNLAGKLLVNELMQYMQRLSLFITADSGPMHIASSFNIPMLALFGPTNDSETSPWNASNSIIVKQDSEYLACQPCMRRICYLEHNKCMHNITSEKIVQIAIDLLQKASI